MNIQTLVIFTTELMENEMNKYKDVEFSITGKYLTVKQGPVKIEIVRVDDHIVEITFEEKFMTYPDASASTEVTREVTLVASTILMASQVIMSLLTTLKKK